MYLAVEQDIEDNNKRDIIALHILFSQKE